MFENKYPYTDFHELNLDYILKQSAEVTDKVTHIDAEIVDVTRNTLQRMTDDGTLEELINETALENISSRVSEVEKLKNRIDYFFPGGTASAPCGESMIIKLADNTGIIVDFGIKTTGADIISTLVTNGITKIKAIMISHYHDDHTGGGNAEGLKAVLNSSILDFTDCKAYMPHKNIDWTQFIGTDYQVIKARAEMVDEFVESKNIEIVRPEEDDVVDFGNGLTCTFNNLLTTYFADYYPYTLSASDNDVGYTNYNNFSMVMSFRHLDHVCFYTGDINKPAERHMAALAQNADIWVVEHHGLNWSVDSEYLYNLAPKISIIPTGATYYPAYRMLKTDIAKVLNGCIKTYLTTEAEMVHVIDSVSDLDGYGSQGMLNMNELNMSLAWGTTLDDDSIDLNTVTVPGNYEVKNGTIGMAMAHSPFPTENTGFRLTVMQGSPNIPLIQLAMATGANSMSVALRKASYASSTNTYTFSEWRTTKGSYYYNAPITANDVIGCTINNSKKSYVASQNGFITIALDLQASTTISADSTIYSFDAKTNAAREVNFVCYNSQGDIYPMTIDIENDGTYNVKTRVEIPSGKTIKGSVTMAVLPSNFV